MRTGCFAAAVAVAILVAGGAPALAEVPQIVAGKNREIEVIFNNNCVVYFSAQGRLTNRLPICSGAQIAQALDAATRYRREQGLDGRPVAENSDPRALQRVCCERKGKDWFTSRALCRATSGVEVPDRACRNDEDNRPWSSSRSDYERVCCGRGLHDWFTTRGECRHAGGLEVLKGMCRDDRDTSSWWHGHRGEDYDNYDDRPAAGAHAGKADISLTCYGEGEKPVLESWDDRKWVAQRSQFRAAVLIELNRSGAGYAGRIHPSGRLLPPIHSGDTNGWWPLKDVVVNEREVRARYKLNGLNKPILIVDRRSGFVSIAGIELFRGRCWSGV